MKQDTLTEFWGGNDKLWPEPQRYYAINYNGLKMKAHQHEQTELMYAVNGSCHVYYWENEILHDCILKKGDFILIGKGIRHELFVEDQTLCRILNLEFGLAKISEETKHCTCIIKGSQSVRRLIAHSEQVYLRTDHDGRLQRIIIALQDQLTDQTDAKENHLMANVIMTEFMIELSRQCVKQSIWNQGSRYIKKSLQYIERNYDQDITVDSIAKNAGVSPSHLQRLFKKTVGKSLFDYINLLRIRQAKILLETSSLPVVDIAFNVGFHSRQHFTNAFKQKEGCSPVMYRKQKGNKDIYQGF